MIILTDPEILVLCQKGDKRAFRLLVERYMKRGYFSALGFVHDHELALDLSMETFVKCWRTLKKIDPRRPFFTWYYAILKNMCLNEIRDAKKRYLPFSRVGRADEKSLNSVSEANGDLEKKDLQERVWQALNLLKEHDREIIMLREFQDLSYQEIAETLDCPIGTVMSRLYSARKALKEKLTKIMESEV